MKPAVFEKLVGYCAMAVPEGLKEQAGDLRVSAAEPLMSRAFFKRAMDRAGVSQPRREKLRQALDRIEADKDLLRLSRVMIKDAHRALIHQRACDFRRPSPGCVPDRFTRQAYPLLLALGCLEHGLASLRARGIPREDYEEVCWRMADQQLRRYEQTGSTVIRDYPWDMNFYGCAIFLHDRFYFVPYRWEGPRVYRDGEGRTLALWPRGARVRRDGQLDGVNGVRDPEAFRTVWREKEGRLTAHPVNPLGLIEAEPVTIDLGRWRPALAPGDMMLALHIPGGPGYEPQRVRRSMSLALAFFDRWFPEIAVKGFWSESWLYDPGLARLLPPEGRIVSVQRQFYNYPGTGGSRMAKLEVFGSGRATPADMQRDTSLQRSLARLFEQGGQMHCTHMFVLREDVPRVGQQPYLSQRDIDAWQGR